MRRAAALIPVALAAVPAAWGNTTAPTKAPATEAPTTKEPTSAPQQPRDECADVPFPCGDASEQTCDDPNEDVFNDFECRCKAAGKEDRVLQNHPSCCADQCLACVGWIATEGCDAVAATKPDGILGCDDTVPADASGYCDCTGHGYAHVKMMHFASTCPGSQHFHDDAFNCSHMCNPCHEQDCSAADQCHEAPTCDWSTGACLPSPNAVDGKPCYDGSDETTGDKCTGGLCVGALSCGNVSCSAPDGGHCTVASCNGDQCSSALRPDGTACGDEGMVTMVRSRCLSGICTTCTDLSVSAECLQLENKGCQWATGAGGCEPVELSKVYCGQPIGHTDVCGGGGQHSANNASTCECPAGQLCCEGQFGEPAEGCPTKGEAALEMRHHSLCVVPPGPTGSPSTGGPTVPPMPATPAPPTAAAGGGDDKDDSGSIAGAVIACIAGVGAVGAGIAALHYKKKVGARQRNLQEYTAGQQEYTSAE